MAGKKCTAKRKYEEEHRTYLTEWESLHFFVERNGKPFCLICQVSLAQFKASNLQRHFSSLYANFDQEFRKGTELRKHKLIALKRHAEKHTDVPKIYDALRDPNAGILSTGLEHCTS